RRLSRSLELAFSGSPIARLAGLGALVELAAVTAERTRRRELAQLVPDHVLRQVDGNELVTVMNGQRMSDEIRRNRRAARPGLHDALLAARVHLLDLLE